MCILPLSLLQVYALSPQLLITETDTVPPVPSVSSHLEHLSQCQCAPLALPWPTHNAMPRVTHLGVMNQVVNLCGRNLRIGTGHVPLGSACPCHSQQTPSPPYPHPSPRMWLHYCGCAAPLTCISTSSAHCPPFSVAASLDLLAVPHFSWIAAYMVSTHHRGRAITSLAAFHQRSTPDNVYYCDDYTCARNVEVALSLCRTPSAETPRSQSASPG